MPLASCHNCFECEWWERVSESETRWEYQKQHEKNEKSEYHWAYIRTPEKKNICRCFYVGFLSLFSRFSLSRSFFSPLSARVYYYLSILLHLLYKYDKKSLRLVSFYFFLCFFFCFLEYGFGKKRKHDWRTRWNTRSGPDEAKTSKPSYEALNIGLCWALWISVVAFSGLFCSAFFLAWLNIFIIFPSSSTDCFGYSVFYTPETELFTLRCCVSFSYFWWAKWVSVSDTFSILYPNNGMDGKQNRKIQWFFFARMFFYVWSTFWVFYFIHISQFHIDGGRLNGYRWDWKCFFILSSVGRFLCLVHIFRGTTTLSVGWGVRKVH